MKIMLGSFVRRCREVKNILIEYGERLGICSGLQTSSDEDQVC